MGSYIAERVIKSLARHRIHVADSRILIMGLAFKENCPDLRNTRVTDVMAGLREYNAQVDIYDPWVDPAEAQHEYGIDLISEIPAGSYDAVIVAVAHDRFRDDGLARIRSYCKPASVLFDVKYMFPLQVGVERL
jgi:UDP-N-acetyl-D-galactosamine dehydrogenase